jgi:hypothetical protein
MEVFSTCSFDGINGSEELSFSPGEKFRVLSYYYESDWSRVLNQNDQIGLVPRCALRLDAKDDKWLFPSISRTNAEIYLKDKKSPIGSFVIRCSQTKDGFALSIKLEEDLVGHMYISVSSSSGCVKLWKLKFKSIRSLVDYYKRNPIYNDIRLSEPSVPRMARSLYDFDAQGEWELSMKQNNMISILTYVNRNWYLAVDRRRNHVGIVPRNYIEICAATPTLPSLKSPGQSQLAKRRIDRRDSTGLNSDTKKTKTDLISFEPAFVSESCL